MISTVSKQWLSSIIAYLRRTCHIPTGILVCTTLPALGVSEEAYQNYAHGAIGQSSSFYGGYLSNHRTNFLQPIFQGNGATGFPADYTTKESLQRQAFVGDTTSQTAFRMATDFSGLMAASDPVKSTKPTHAFYWRKRGYSVPAEGMTRTKDKYRVVYTEKQRDGLEKAFKDNIVKFITMKERNVLSKELDLSERQVSGCFVISNYYYYLFNLYMTLVQF